MAAMDTDEVSLPQALAAVQASFADAPGDAQAARQWAEQRGYDWGDSEQLLAQFLQGEARAVDAEESKRAQEGRGPASRRAGARERPGGGARMHGAPRHGCCISLTARRSSRRKGAPTLTADPPPPPPSTELKKLEAIHDALRTDFALRRRMLLTRCDVTMQSFLWGDAAEGREQTIVDSVYAERAALSTEPPPYSVQDALATSKQRIDRMERALADAAEHEGPAVGHEDRGDWRRAQSGAATSATSAVAKRHHAVVEEARGVDGQGGKGGKGGGRGRGKGGRGGGRGGGEGWQEKEAKEGRGAVISHDCLRRAGPSAHTT